ncbi:hypothetical protein PENANT_c047G09101 [Penicillium antarcticum]|uniref:Ribosomal RNA methyltransferase FtsJ domain-containing protein n=1 Tax=Penicillium antarcticum TaxID=416450 RepID=A0A1V6PSB1_9EURO|nr:hypothetical protein PENANT_c047G09101 [Penicillium antarcticum]
MAPGGFSTIAKRKLPGSLIDAITLPPHAGGHEVMANDICRHIIYADITMYSKEIISNEHIPAGHPNSEKFETSRPYHDNQYDIVICGGAVANVHPTERYRSEHERSRLTVSQLIFATNRLKNGGSIVLLLHRVESWDTVCILHAFNKFSDVQLYKHPKCHGIKSSFYLVAKNVDLSHEAAKISLAYWKDLWMYLTFKDIGNIPSPRSSLYNSDDSFVRELLSDFGPLFLNLARPVWRIQAGALRRSPFMRPKPRRP